MKNFINELGEMLNNKEKTYTGGYQDKYEFFKLKNSIMEGIMNGYPEYVKFNKAYVSIKNMNAPVSAFDIRYISKVKNINIDSILANIMLYYDEEDMETFIRAGKDIMDMLDICPVDEDIIDDCTYYEFEKQGNSLIFKMYYVFKYDEDQHVHVDDVFKIKSNNIIV